MPAISVSNMWTRLSQLKHLVILCDTFRTFRYMLVADKSVDS